MKSINSIFEQYCGNIKFDRIMLAKVADMEAGFVNKKQEHIEFFGGALTGVQVVRFLEDDREKLFSDILNVDETTLMHEIHQLKDINVNFIVSSDIFNIACTWVMHKFHVSSYLTEQQREIGKTKICLYLNYKYLTSLLYKYFKYPANPDVATAAYAQLSYKYVLKAKGSWRAALDYRVEEIISKDSIHYKTIANYNEDYSVVLMLNDTQGRINDMLKNIRNVMAKVQQEGSSIKTSSSVVEIDGEKIVKDKTNSLSGYVRYIQTVITDTPSFIKQELLDVIEQAMPTMPPYLLLESLEWISKNYTFVRDNHIEKLVELIMEHAFVYLSDNKNILKQSKDLNLLISSMRGTYLSSRNTEPKMLQIRKEAFDLVKQTIKTKNDSVVSSVRTGVCLYIILRTFTKRFYSS